MGEKFRQKLHVCKGEEMFGRVIERMPGIERGGGEKRREERGGGEKECSACYLSCYRVCVSVNVCCLMEDGCQAKLG